MKCRARLTAADLARPKRYATFARSTKYGSVGTQCSPSAWMLQAKSNVESDVQHPLRVSQCKTLRMMKNVAPSKSVTSAEGPVL